MYFDYPFVIHLSVALGIPQHGKICWKQRFRRYGIAQHTWVEQQDLRVGLWFSLFQCYRVLTALPLSL